MSRDGHFQDTREHLLDIGETVIRGKGFAAVGLAEVLSEAAVPKGSFYHYFRSKEAFGAEMLTRYFSKYDVELRALLFRPKGSARERLLDYFGRWAARDGGNCQQACLAVKLSGEVSDLSEPMRTALVAGMAQVEARLAEAVRAGQLDGSLDKALEPVPLAQSLYSLWVGAELLAKVQRSGTPFQQALVQTESWLRPPMAA